MELRGRWRFEPHGNVAEPQFSIVFDQIRDVWGDAHAVDEGPLGGPKVLNKQVAGINGQPRVAARDREVINDERIAIGAAHHERREIER